MAWLVWLRSTLKAAKKSKAKLACLYMLQNERTDCQQSAVSGHIRSRGAVKPRAVQKHRAHEMVAAEAHQLQ